MIRWYCKKCSLDSDSDTCPQCGKKLSGNALRDIWQVYRVPLSDLCAWKNAFLTLLLFALLLVLILFIGGFLLGNVEESLTALLNGSGAAILLLIPAGLALLLAAFILQGRETLVYCLDSKGAHMQTWHAPGRVRCWARMQAYHPEDIVDNPDGTSILLSQTRHILWADVQDVVFAPARGEIRLFSSLRLAPFVLRLPPDEYDIAERMVKKTCRKALQNQK